MKRKFSDLHCHNHMRAHFQMQEKQKKFERKDEFSPWTVIASSKKSEDAGKMGASYSQMDLVKCWNSNLRLTFNSLYPLERQFVKGFKPTIGEDKWFKFLVSFATSHKLPLRDFIQVAYMRIPDKVVDYVQSDFYDYWDSLRRELAFVIKDSGKVIAKNEIHVPGAILAQYKAEIKRSSRFPQEYIAKNACYRVPKSKAELDSSLANDNEITMVLTIEGAHSLGTDRANVDEISKRVQEIKKGWAVPIFFITFAHHFDNKLCGHAHSIPDQGKLLLKQNTNMNKGFNPNGRRILKEILGLDQNLEKDPALGYRILIDVKHMSATSRKEYYSEVVLPCLQKGDKIPVIASHCGYSGISTLDEHIKLMPKEKDDYTDATGKFNAWNINMCDEDIEIIVKTQGLFGLSFDQRILGITKKEKETKRNGIQLIWENIEAIVKSAYSNPNLTDVQKPQIWKSITIGTDFEGLIDPVNPYPTALEFELMANNLVFEVDQARKDPKAKHLAHLKSREDVEKAVDDFCYNNADAFVKTNFPL